MQISHIKIVKKRSNVTKRQKNLLIVDILPGYDTPLMIISFLLTFWIPRPWCCDPGICKYWFAAIFLFSLLTFNFHWEFFFPQSRLFTIHLFSRRLHNEITNDYNQRLPNFSRVFFRVIWFNHCCNCLFIYFHYFLVSLLSLNTLQMVVQKKKISRISPIRIFFTKKKINLQSKSYEWSLLFIGYKNRLNTDWDGAAELCLLMVCSYTIVIMSQWDHARIKMFRAKILKSSKNWL